MLDLRGRGDSLPPIGRGSPHGQYESIVEEIPAASDWLRGHKGDVPQHWVAHSWGGVLAAATLARLPAYRERVASLTLFATKRCVRVWNPTRLLYIEVIWLRLAPLMAAVCGYLPARALRIGSDSESRASLAGSMAWVRPGPWVDPVDGFDYGRALADVELPPILAFAGAADAALGHPDDVRDFLDECGRGHREFRLLSRAKGHRRDYGHVDLLTAREAADDHFPEVAEWIRAADEQARGRAGAAASDISRAGGRV